MLVVVVVVVMLVVVVVVETVVVGVGGCDNFGGDGRIYESFQGAPMLCSPWSYPEKDCFHFHSCCLR